jgi:GGDEF domain-containing protein
MFAVITPGAQLEKCQIFAARVVQSLSSAKVAVQGNPVKVSWSAGVVSSAEDAILGAALLDQARARLEEAQKAGGCRVHPGR